MKIFKFGGASIKSADAIKNMCSIISNHASEQLIVVVSSMGKTTNALEECLSLKISNHSFNEKISEVKKYHLLIVEELFGSDHKFKAEVEHLFEKLEEQLSNSYEYDKLYDQVVSFGELLSSKIVAAYLMKCQNYVTWIDARRYIKTSSSFREGLVDWQLTEELMQHDLPEMLKTSLLVTQGFIGSEVDGFTTTLGREGSDFSAAIFASSLNAKEVCVWKDVPGILNADPKLIKDAVLFDELPYHEAAEMTYYGASVIHPKTIKPLANKHIPLYVKCFDKPKASGTKIHDCILEKIPTCIIIKKDQILISFNVIDYTFINEGNLSLIFHELSEVDLKINIMQNSAISFSIVVDNQPEKIDRVLKKLKPYFEIRYNTGLQLITLKNYTLEKLDNYTKDKDILLEQISRNNYRLLIAP